MGEDFLVAGGSVVGFREAQRVCMYVYVYVCASALVLVLVLVPVYRPRLSLFRKEGIGKLVLK